MRLAALAVIAGASAVVVWAVWYFAERRETEERKRARRLRAEECREVPVPEPKGGFGSRAWRLE